MARWGKVKPLTTCHFGLRRAVHNLGARFLLDAPSVSHPMWTWAVILILILGWLSGSCQALGPLNMLIIFNAALLNFYGNRVKWNAPQNDITYLAFAWCRRSKLTPSSERSGGFSWYTRKTGSRHTTPPFFRVFANCRFHFMETPRKVAFAFSPFSRLFMPALKSELCR